MSLTTWQKLKRNPELWSTYLMRETVIDAIRSYFKTNGFHEVETPLLVEHPGTEPYLDVFATELMIDEGKQPAFLLTSPEYAMKKLLVAGMHKIFQVCKSFRNLEGPSSRHNPEFTILEWYQTPADYREIMADCEGLFLHALKQTQPDNQTNTLHYQGRDFDLTAPWPKITVAEAFQKYVGVDADGLLSFEALKKVAQEHEYTIEADTTWEQLYNQLFLNLIEPELAKYTQPVFIYDYPTSQAALSKRKKDDPRYAERFELYVGRLEMANAFSELNDPVEQEERFREELALRASMGKVRYELDHDYIQALREGLPDTGGIALGVDRLVMLFANAASIEETMFFPMRDVFADPE